MVTVITDKLKNQSLEDVSPEPIVISTAVLSSYATQQPGRITDSRLIQRHRKDGSTQGHYRTWSYPTHSLRKFNPESVFSDCSLSSNDSSARAHKRLRRSSSVPGGSATVDQVWTPRASAVWHPIKTFEQSLRKSRSVACPEESKACATASCEPDSNCVSTSGMNAISTPPASPTPRPASANAALNDLFVFSSIDEESEDMRVSRSVHKGYSATKNDSNNLLRGLSRSHSHPCFATDSLQAKISAGVKRKNEEQKHESRLRPALDLAKMEETSYYRCRSRKKVVKIPKYMNKRATKNLTPFFTEPEKFFLKPIIDAPLNAEATSIMITPTSSPTKQLDWNNSISSPSEKQNSTQNKNLVDLTLVNEKSTDKRLFPIDCISELDLNSIEEDDV